MPTGPESVCCKEYAKAVEKADCAVCITQKKDFVAVCTNKAVIETAFNQYLETEKFIDDESLNE